MLGMIEKVWRYCVLGIVLILLVWFWVSQIKSSAVAQSSLEQATEAIQTTQETRKQEIKADASVQVQKRRALDAVRSSAVQAKGELIGVKNKEWLEGSAGCAGNPEFGVEFIRVLNEHIARTNRELSASSVP